MQSNPLLGVILHGIGGLAAASFYVPFRRVTKWSWETCWLVNGLFAWILTPMIVALMLNRGLFGLLAQTPVATLLWVFLFGMLWGVGAIMYGMTMRYLGLSLGVSVALGFCAIFGTLMGPIVQGTYLEIIAHLPGQVIHVGLLVCLMGIVICGLAGGRKERERRAEHFTEMVAEYDLRRGLITALLAGFFSAALSWAFTAGKPLAAAALASGTPQLWMNTPVLVVALWGGFATNLVWCMLLACRNRSLGDYLPSVGGHYAANVAWCALAGVTWYMQFLFYGMGTTQLGALLDFSSWTLHMSFIIIFGNLWGLALHEWRGTSRRTLMTIVGGTAVLILSIIVVGFGNMLDKPKPAPAAETVAVTGQH